MDRKEKYKNNGRNFFKDGRTKEIMSNPALKKLYYSWIGIRRRAHGHCFAITDRHKHIYKNIDVTPEWHDWNKYKEWALKNGYKEGLTIDRIDNNKGYSPQNCRWVTIQENNRNKTTIKKYKYNDQELTLGQIAELNKINKQMFSNRVAHLGWPIEKAIKYTKGTSEKQENNKERNKNMQKDYENGLTVKQIAAKYDMGERNVYSCIKVKTHKI